LTARHRSALALVLGLAWACDYTPELPPAPALTPRPSAAPNSGGVPVIVVPIPNQTPLPGPVPPSAPFRIVLATPEETSTIKLPSDPSEKLRRPILDFEFRYPQALTLDNAHANIQVSLRSRGLDCLWTDLGYATRLDRDDSVYVANSVARFRTGPWQQRNQGTRPCALDAFTTDQLVFHLTTTPGSAAPFTLFTGWNFVSN
jgi:hypothetical protein